MPRPNAQLAERLLSEGRIRADQYEGVLHYMERSGQRVEEALLETAAFTEADLLKYLAGMYRTRFVTTEKLSRADIDPATLALVPRKIAERLQVFPVLYDGANSVLSVVAADLGDPDLAKQVQLASNAREVNVYVARPAAVKAAIAKHYGGDIHAFATVDRRGVEQYQSMLNVYERNLISEESLATAINSREVRNKERTFNERDMERSAQKAQRPGRSAESTGRNPAVPRGSVAGQSSGVALEDFTETLVVLVSLLENNRGELRGHSSLVARMIRKVGERIGLSAREVHALACAALLHDVGKSSAYHLTALNVSEYEGHRVAAQKSYQTPLRLFESVQLAESAEIAVRSMYERFDGSGHPDGLAGKDIPLGGRLLAITDTYADLTQNSRNPFRKTLSPAEACEVLGRYRGKVFDPNLVDLFRHTVLGEDIRARLLADRPVVMIVDSDPEESTVLELRLQEQGFDVRAARSAESALKLLEAGEIEVSIADTDFGDISGFALLERVRAMPDGADMPWVFLTRDSGRESVARAFELGAADYVIRPVPTDVLVAKVRKLFDARAGKSRRGVSGSLTEMALPDIVQILAQGRKTGRLKIETRGESGEIHFENGQVVNAMWGKLRGEDAFYAMCTLTAGEFALDPGFKPGARVIQATAESLLLEGMRRLDESSTQR
jgi:response regulator RpfG family c-di-GMP phosphodiesterase